MEQNATLRQVKVKKAAGKTVFGSVPGGLQLFADKLVFTPSDGSMPPDIYLKQDIENIELAQLRGVAGIHIKRKSDQKAMQYYLYNKFPYRFHGLRDDFIRPWTQDLVFNHYPVQPTKPLTAGVLVATMVVTFIVVVTTFYLRSR